MGCDAALPCAESLPRKRVEFDHPFQMSATEVTVSQFRKFVNATGYRTDAEKAGEIHTWRAPGFPLRGNQPVVFMSLNDAKAYCESIGARVPLETEWEYAARAGSTTYHYWGEEIDDRYLWYFNNTDQRPEPVGRKLPNALGTLRYGRQRNGVGAARASLQHHARRCGLGSRRIVRELSRAVSASQRTAPARHRSWPDVSGIQEQHLPTGGTPFRLRHSLCEIGYQWLRRNVAALAMASRATRRIPGMVKKPWIVPG